jgi:MSHA biogenesis protein MshJ
MKASLLKLQLKIDAMSVRERAMIFGAAAAVIVFVLYALLLDPMFARQTILRAQISQQQNNMLGIDAEITGTVQAAAIDPDQANRARLAALKATSTKLSDNLRSVHNSLVAPENIAPLLERILKGNVKLHLVGVKSLPVIPFNGSFESDPSQVGAAVAAAGAGRAIYAHGVEVTVRGNYLDMLEYMDALEAMPAQLFWGKARLEVDAYPEARLSLTLYTLSLDKKWITL